MLLLRNHKQFGMYILKDRSMAYPFFVYAGLFHWVGSAIFLLYDLNTHVFRQFLVPKFGI